MKIAQIIGREILDSRGQPTVEAEVWLQGGARGSASVPSGASTGSREAVELRDGGDRYNGKGVLKAVHHVNHDIAELLKGLSAFEQSAIDEKLCALDGTPNKSRLGANAILAVSLAVAKAAAQARNQSFVEYMNKDGCYSLPVPLMNIVNGGAHADNNLDFQEFMIVPAGLTNFAEALRAGVEIFHALKVLLKKAGYSTNVGDEGGFAPSLPHQEAAFQLIMEAIVKAGYKPEQDILLALDVASSEFYENGVYVLSAENKRLDSHAFTDYLQNFVRQYPVISIEDGMAENDTVGWRHLTEVVGASVQLIGDDLFVTNTELLQQGIEQKLANSILIKPNQIGTLTETLEAISLAKSAKYNAIMSHRSGETEDTTIADLAVALNVGQIKTGSLCRTDRVAKYNQLLRLEAWLGSGHYYAGRHIFDNVIHKRTSVGALG